MHPAAPREGIRAARPDEIWHIDTTIVCLLDGTRAYLHAVIDNYSRRILSWRLSDCFDPSVCAVLLIEAWWRTLKHQWLFLHQLDSVATVRRLAAFYVEEHNTRVPHAAFDGQTPDEMYFGTGEHVPAALAIARTDARRRRLEVDRTVRCAVCV